MENGNSSGTVSDTKERMHGALMPSSGGPSLRWEHRVELWKHPKARHILYCESLLRCCILCRSIQNAAQEVHVGLRLACMRSGSSDAGGSSEGMPSINTP